MSAVARPPGRDSSEESVADLVSRASQQISELVQEEMLLARAEMTQKGRRFGAGGGLVGALSAPSPPATEGLGVGSDHRGPLAAVAAVMAASGKKRITKAGTPAPQQAIHSVQADVAEIKEAAHR
ncbi:phage holin family protein [Streptomyces avidinii]|uniref:phage holin family protein n=1 Tax=Streptomyces avidinii TaxID=1895 RepID=UPI00386FA03D|nr:phage holin family protein [Streptomyces avidinii]